MLAGEAASPEIRLLDFAKQEGRHTEQPCPAFQREEAAPVQPTLPPPPLGRVEWRRAAGGHSVGTGPPCHSPGPDHAAHTSTLLGPRGPPGAALELSTLLAAEDKFHRQGRSVVWRN